DDLAPGRVDQLGEAGRHRIEADGWPGAEYLSDNHAGPGRRGFRQDGTDVAAAFAHPVRDEQILAMARDGAFPPGHNVDPRRIARLDAEFRVGNILASAPGYSVVDNHKFAMIAQIDPATDHRPEEIADRQGHAHFGAAGGELAPVA